MLRRGIAVGNGTVTLAFSADPGFRLDDIINVTTESHYLSPETIPKLSAELEKGPPFSVRVTGGGLVGTYGSTEDIVLDKANVVCREKRVEILEATGRVKRVENLAFRLRIDLEDRMPFGTWFLSFRNDGRSPLSMDVLFPIVGGIEAEKIDDIIRLPPLPKNAPQYYPLSFIDFCCRKTNEGFFIGYVPNTSDVPLIRIDRKEILSKNLYNIICRVPVDIPPSEARMLPPVVVGVHKGNYSVAAKEYSRIAHKALKFCDAPTWLKEAGAVYGYSGGGGGAVYLYYPNQSLSQRIGTFENLTKLLEEARRLGTSIVYIWDYWEGVTNPKDRSPYWNKGDYIPRFDMGGPTAFKEGIRRLHEAGGKIIVYVEPFITFKYSTIGAEHGAEWAMIDRKGKCYEFYPDNWDMCSALKDWQNYVADLSRYLVEEYDVDGIFLDSYGCQWSHRCYNNTHGHESSPEVFNKGVFNLVDAVKRAVQSAKKDAVVITESFHLLLSQHVQGSLYWPPDDIGRIYSTIRSIVPESTVFTNGLNLLQLKLEFAAGNSLALADFWLGEDSTIKSLLDVRREYRDALVYGTQEILDCENSNFVSYLYRGERYTLIVIVNFGAEDATARVELGVEDKSSRWRDLFSGKTYKARSSLVIHLESKALRILIKI